MADRDIGETATGPTMHRTLADLAEPGQEKATMIEEAEATSHKEELAAEEPKGSEGHHTPVTPAQQQLIISNWWNSHVSGSEIARSTAAVNALRSALPHLVKALLQGDK